MSQRQTGCRQDGNWHTLRMAAIWSRSSWVGRYVSAPAAVTLPVSGSVIRALMVAADAAMLRAKPAGMAPNPARSPGRLSSPANVLSPIVTDRCGRRPCRVNTRFPPRLVVERFAAAPVAAAAPSAPELGDASVSQAGSLSESVVSAFTVG